MSDHINYALGRINFEIPAHLLSLAYRPAPHDHFNTVDNLIHHQVLMNRVNLDTNIITGTIAMIDLAALSWVGVEDGYLIEIPEHVTQGRPITSVLGIEKYYEGAVGGTPYNPGSTQTGEVYLIPPRTVFTSVFLSGTALSLRCMLGNVDNLANLPERSKEAYGELCVLACKADIYNKLALGVNIYNMSDAAVDGRIRQIVDGYADAQQTYSEMLKGRWSKIHTMADRKFMQRYVKSMINPY